MLVAVTKAALSVYLFEPQRGWGVNFGGGDVFVQHQLAVKQILLPVPQTPWKTSQPFLTTFAQIKQQANQKT